LAFAGGSDLITAGLVRVILKGFAGVWRWGAPLGHTVPIAALLEITFQTRVNIEGALSSYRVTVKPEFAFSSVSVIVPTVVALLKLAMMALLRLMFK